MLLKCSWKSENFILRKFLQLSQCGILGPIRKKKLLINIKFKKSQHGVQLGAIILSKKVLDPLQYRSVLKASLINYIKAKKNKRLRKSYHSK